METLIRQRTVVHDGLVQVPIPEEFNEQEVEVQVIVQQTQSEPKSAPKKGGGLGYLVGSLSHLTSEQNEKIDQELKELRDSWERDIF